MATFQPNDENKVNSTLYKTKIDGLFFIPHKIYPDDRGFFKELCRLPELQNILEKEFCVKQINHARSKTNVIRGFHAEGWNKLVTVTQGKCFCALVDVRPNSKTFLSVETFQLGLDKDCLQGAIFISQGIANSVCAISGPVDYLYFVDKLYKDRDPNGDISISLFDPDIQVEWPIKKSDMIYSERDKNAITLQQKFPNLKNT